MTPKPTTQGQKCQNCARPFAARREWQKFCSERCRLDYHSGGRLTKTKIEEVLKKTARQMIRAGELDEVIGAAVVRAVEAAMKERERRAGA